jgi:hypothetical protein
MELNKGDTGITKQVNHDVPPEPVMVIEILFLLYEA